MYRPSRSGATLPVVARIRRLGSVAHRVLLGPRPSSRLTATHCIHSAAETFVTVSLAGSIFFSVSAEAARPRVLLFLIIGLAPVLVMAPLVGPFIDRLRGGLRWMIIVTFAVRCALALILAQHLRTLVLFPLVFATLVTANGYSVARNALLPQLVAHPERELVGANARMSRTATMTGAVAAAAAVWLYTATSGVWTLRVAAALYGLGLLQARRLPHTAEEPRVSVPVLALGPASPEIRGGVLDLMALRAAGGFALFAFVFALRSEAEDSLMIGLLLAASAAGGFAGTVVTPMLRRRMDERAMLTAALGLVAGATALCGLVFTPALLVMTMFCIGLSTSVGRRALDALIQFLTPRGRHARLYARVETRLELAWVAAAALAVSLAVASWVAILALAGFLAAVTAAHVLRHQLWRHQLLVVASPAALTAQERLLLRARALAEEGYHEEAVLVALGAHDPLSGPAPITDLERHEILTGSRVLGAEEATAVIDEISMQTVGR